MTSGTPGTPIPPGGCESSVALTSVATTAINVEEIVRGLRDAEVSSAQRLFRGLVVLPIEEAAAWQGGSWRRSFAQHGVTLVQADCLIAAVAHQQGAVLTTGNPKDLPMQLSVQHWPVGE